MRAALFLDGHEDLVVDEVDVSAPIGSEVLIHTAASGLCHSDLHFMETEGWVVPRPVVLGHEAAGIVEAVGPYVRANEGFAAMKAGDVVRSVIAFD